MLSRTLVTICLLLVECKEDNNACTPTARAITVDCVVGGNCTMPCCAPPADTEASSKTGDGVVWTDNNGTAIWNASFGLNAGVPVIAPEYKNRVYVAGASAGKKHPGYPLTLFNVSEADTIITCTDQTAGLTYTTTITVRVYHKTPVHLIVALIVAPICILLFGVAVWQVAVRYRKAQKNPAI